MMAQGTAEFQVPRVFQILIIIYVVLTGEVLRAFQAALFGLSGGGETSYVLVFASAIAVDLARLAPLFVLSRHPLGVLHPVIIAVLLWPILVAVPSAVEQLGGIGGLFLADPVRPPFFLGLGWLPAETTWLAVAKYNFLQCLALLATYLGFAAFGGAVEDKRQNATYDPAALRRLFLILIILNLVSLLAFLYFRGGLESHLSDLSRGRFRALAGLGPLIAVFDLGLVALILWVAAKPEDVRKLVFLLSMVGVIAVQFLSNGSRSGALVVAMLVGLTWAMRTRRIPWKIAAVLAPVLFLSLGALAIARTSGLTNESALEAVTKADMSTFFEGIQSEIELRQAVSGPIPVVVDGMRVMDGPLLGRSYMAAIFAFVPRSVWEDKPRGPGSLYAQNFLGEVREGTAVPIGAVAESYWNFGIPGLLALFFLYGFLLRKVHDFYLSRGESPFVLAFSIFFITTFHVTTDDLVQFQQQMILFLIIFGLARLTVPRQAEVEARSSPRPSYT